jgi:predicted nucleotidyltransferase
MDFAHPFRVVSPTLDGDVLAVLAGADEEFTGRRIHRLLGHGSEPGVRKAVERLVDQGIVLRRQAGRANLYRLNRQHVSVEAIELLAEARSQLIAWLQEAIGAWEVTPRSAAMFGSVARAQAGPDSDLDLLVVRPSRIDEQNATWQSQLGSLQRSATDWTGNDARIVELGEDELAQAEPLLTEVVRDGLALFGSLDVLRDAIKANRR